MTTKQRPPRRKRGAGKGVDVPLREEIWPIKPDPDEYGIDNDEAVTQQKIDDLWDAFVEALRLGPERFDIPEYWPDELQEYLGKHGFRYSASPVPPGAKK